MNRNSVTLETSKNRAVIHVNWNDETSIKEAEKLKLLYENKGYTLINTIGGISTGKLVYKLMGVK